MRYAAFVDKLRSSYVEEFLSGPGQSACSNHNILDSVHRHASSPGRAKSNPGCSGGCCDYLNWGGSPSPTLTKAKHGTGKIPQILAHITLIYCQVQGTCRPLLVQTSVVHMQQGPSLGAIPLTCMYTHRDDADCQRLNFEHGGTRYRSIDAKVVNCGTFFVYYLAINATVATNSLLVFFSFCPGRFHLFLLEYFITPQKKSGDLLNTFYELVF